MKKILAFIVALCMMFCAAACGEEAAPSEEITYNTRETTAVIDTSASEDSTAVTESSETTISPVPVQTTDYLPVGADGEAFAKSLGYEKGTYEFDYFSALAKLSFFTRFAKSGVASRDSYQPIGGEAVYSYRDESLMPFVTLYEPILQYAQTILSACDFGTSGHSFADLNAYKATLGDVSYSDEALKGVFVLAFAGIDTNLIKNSEILLGLADAYPAYDGEFRLSEEVCGALSALIEACRAVEENRESLHQIYDDFIPSVTITEEFDAAKHAVKVTFATEGEKLHISQAFGDKEYVENYQYQIIYSTSGRKQDLPLPMESPLVMYIPVSYYRDRYYESGTPVEKVSVPLTVIRENGHEIEVRVELTLDPFEYYSDEPIRVKDDFLDVSLREFFGGDYSERDLLRITEVIIDMSAQDGVIVRHPSIYLYGYDEDASKKYVGCQYQNYFESEFPRVISEEAEADLAHFHALFSVYFWDYETYRKDTHTPPIWEELKEYTASEINLE